MKDLYICNVSSNFVSKININKYKEQKIYLSTDEKLLGSHGIDIVNNKLYVAANDNFNFYEVDVTGNNLKKYYTGMLTNDLKLYKKYMYLICSENNCLIMYDIEENRLCYEITCGNYPHSMDMSHHSKLICVTNMHNNELTLVNYETNEFTKKIRTGNLPMKSKFFKDGRYIFVCESNLGCDVNGTFSVYDAYTGDKCKTITLDNSPIDMFLDYTDNIIFISNHLGKSVSIVDLDEFKEIGKIEVQGNPRGIYKIGRFLYIVVNDKSELLKYDMYAKTREFIELGADPTSIYCY